MSKERRSSKPRRDLHVPISDDLPSSPTEPTPPPIAEKLTFSRRMRRFLDDIRKADVKDRANIYLTLAIATFSLALAVISIWQIVEFTRATKIDSRAYLVVERVTPRTVQPGSLVSFSVAIKNTGKTPAYSVNHRVGIRIGNFLARNDMDTLRHFPLGYGPTIGGQGSGEIQIERFTLNDSLYALVGELKLGLYIFGRIDYQDEFGDSRFQTFAVQFNPKDFRFSFIPFGYGGR